MPDKLMEVRRAQWARQGMPLRPIMLAIAGDSAAGKSTLTRGLVEALGPERVTAVCTDDYHRYDRQERRNLPFTPLHPACNYIEIMEQHLQLLAMGQPILKPVYDHHHGVLGRPELVEPRQFVIVEGLLPLHTRLARACFDVTVYLDPPEWLRYRWKLSRDCTERGYAPEQVFAELRRREPEAAAYIRPQRAHADIVVRFSPLQEPPNADQPEVLAVAELDDRVLSATVLLRPTIPHPDLSSVLTDDTRRAIHLKLVRDEDGKPVDALHLHGHAPRDLCQLVEDHIWRRLGVAEEIPTSLGRLDGGTRSEPLALTQLILLYHMLYVARERELGPHAAPVPAVSRFA